MAFSIRDPATGNVKPVVYIAGAGVGLVVLFIAAKGGGGGVTSGGQSGDLTGSLGTLNDGLVGLGNIPPDTIGSGGAGRIPYLPQYRSVYDSTTKSYSTEIKLGPNLSWRPYRISPKGVPQIYNTKSNTWYAVSSTEAWYAKNHPNAITTKATSTVS